jgi:hypothetical protein
MRTCNGISNRNTKIVIVTVITAVMLLGTTALTTITIAESVLAYRTNHATSQVNDCGNGELPLNVGCQNTGSQIQGDRNSVALSSQQTFPPPPPTTGTLIVIKVVECVEGEECPGLPDPSIFTIDVVSVCDTQGNCENVDTFPGSSEGTTLTLEPGIYRFDGEEADIPPNLDIAEVDLSPGCTGTIQAGQEITCTITNILEPEPPTTGTLIVKKVVQCAAGQQCPNLPAPSIFQIFVGSVCNPPLECENFVNFPGSSEGTTLTLEPGEYRSSEVVRVVDIPPGLQLIGAVGDSGCTGSIQAGQEITCIFTNTFRPDA